MLDTRRVRNHQPRKNMNQPLLVVLPYHSGDFKIAKKLLDWISELGSCKPHSMLLCADSAVPQEQMRELMDIARPNFVRVTTMIVTVPASAAWKPNEMFLAAARQVKETCKLPFLWLEADAIPIYAGWLDDIAEAYKECPARFMGSIIKQTGQVGLPAEYLNGVAVYPNDAIEIFEKIATIKDGTQAWDIGGASVVVPRSMNTPLIFHYYGTKELPPVFVAARASDAPKNHVMLDFVPFTAAIFHRSKGGELIDLLRAREKSRMETHAAARAHQKLVFDENTSVEQAKSTLEELKQGQIPQVGESKSPPSNVTQPLTPKPRGNPRAPANT